MQPSHTHTHTLGCRLRPHTAPASLCSKTLKCVVRTVIILMSSRWLKNKCKSSEIKSSSFSGLLLLDKILWKSNKYPNKSLIQEPLAYESFHTSPFKGRHPQGLVWVHVRGIQINHNNTNSHSLTIQPVLQKAYMFKCWSRHLIRAPLCLKNNHIILKFVVKLECRSISGPFIQFSLRQHDVGLSVWVVGYYVKLIVKVGTCTNWLWGSWADPSAHMRETYLCICFYEANKNPPLSLAQLPPWLIYVLEFAPHCYIGEAGRWPGVWVCEPECVCVRVRIALRRNRSTW